MSFPCCKKIMLKIFFFFCLCVSGTSTSQAIDHAVTILKVSSARTSKRAFGIMNASSVFVTIELFSKANATNLTCILLLLRMHTTYMLE